MLEMEKFAYKMYFCSVWNMLNSCVIQAALTVVTRQELLSQISVKGSSREPVKAS